uniref:Fungal lipase-like domain-containing protein n=1 Tax=Panagrolaimus superbus TaxID=310955 RepID=A0A914Y461_9BILA
MKILVLFTLFLFNAIFCDGREYKRDVAMPFAAAAYSTNPNLCLSKVAKLLNPTNEPSYNITVYRQYTVANCSSFNDTCFGYIAISSFTKEIIIGLRGTSDFDQLLTQGWNSNEMVPFISGGKVSKYFFNGFNGIWMDRGMRNDFYALKNRFPNYLFIFVGHSIGGAMASLMAATVISTGVLTEDKITLFTFGQPRIGDKTFADAFNAMEIKTFRIVHNRDIIPHLPPLNDSLYYHHRQEVWYNNDMGLNDEYTVCSYENGEDPACSDSINATTLNINDHKYYFGREFTQYGITGCPDLVTMKETDLNNLKVAKKRSKHFLAQ